MLNNSRHILNDDRCKMAAVFNVRDGDSNTYLGCRFRLGVVIGEIEVSSMDFCFVMAAFILTTVTLRFSCDIYTIVNADNNGQLELNSLVLPI